MEQGKSEQKDHVDAAGRGSPKSRWRKRLLWLVVGALIAVIGLELYARFGLGLGDPPLSIADPEIEYLFKPSRTYHRFGNVVHYNDYSMRSSDFPKTKSSPDELRVLVMGDSVVNGGALTTQADLATEKLGPELTKALGRPAVVAHISAGGWGPGNLLAYVRRHGTFDADACVIVLSSHDAADVPTFEPIVGTGSFPDRAPISALGEAITRYLPIGRAKPAPSRANDATYDQGIGQLRQLVLLLREHKVSVAIILHAECNELTNGFAIGHARIRQLADEMSVPTLDDADALRAHIAAGGNPYRDNIHINVAGQKLLTELLARSVIPLLTGAAPQ